MSNVSEPAVEVINRETQPVKQRILRSWIGHVALAARDRFDLLRSAWFRLESVGTVANDQLASSLVTKLCKPGKTFVDVGAHIGSIIASVQHHDRTIKIVAVEASPEKVVRLRCHFPDVKIFDCAVGDSEGEISFFVNNSQSGFSSLGRPDESNDSIQEITIPIKKLDSLISPEGVDVIKIDVEGAELGVIRGGSELLSKGRPIIMFESAPAKEDGLGYTREDLWRHLSNLDYLILLPNRLAHNGDALSLEGFIDSHVYPRRTTNYFSIPKERRIEVRDLARNILGVRAS